MNKLILLVSIFAIMMGISDAHIYRDHWMNQKGINIDYMHYKAMSDEMGLLPRCVHCISRAHTLLCKNNRPQPT